MKTFAMLLSSAVVLSLSGSARAEDLGFRFDASKGVCVNAAGEEGLNPDFVGACGDLHEKDLAGAYLFGADLRGADLHGANLAKADLAHADLTGGDLHGAVLAGAYLHQANLTGADLRCATFLLTLKGADLSGTNLSGARFCPATELPFSVAVAQARGMTRVGGDDSVASR